MHKKFGTVLFLILQRNPLLEDKKGYSEASSFEVTTRSQIVIAPLV